MNDMRILMVCLGNICRSPIAEGVLRRKIEEHGLDWTVSSAGTNSFHIGEEPHRHSQKVCNLNGVDISSQRARKFKPEDFEQYDKIYAMADDVYDDIMQIAGRKAKPERLDYFLNELDGERDQSVPDPWYGTEAGYAPVYDLIERTCEAIINKYK